MRVVLLTLAGPFPTAVLRRVLGQGVEPVALITSALTVLAAAGAERLARRRTPSERPAPLPVEVAGATPTALTLARSRGVPVLPWDRRDPAATVAATAPDLILVACFPYRLPAEVFRLPRVACLNLHPSLLPRYRGPHPLFWQLRAGERATGVTLHHVSERLDAGDLVVRRPVALPPGASGPEIDTLLGAAAGDLAVEALAAAARGEPLPRETQDETLASTWGVPGPEDFDVPMAWSARRAFDFLRGTAEWGRPYRILTGDRAWTTHTATGCQPDAVLGRAWEREGSRLRVQFAPGVLEVTVDP
jgi:methionyl-tRNA formyltransferase